MRGVEQRIFVLEASVDAGRRHAGAGPSLDPWIWFLAVGSGLTGEEFPRTDALARRCRERPTVTCILDREADVYGALQRGPRAARRPAAASRVAP